MVVMLCRFGSPARERRVTSAWSWGQRVLQVTFGFVTQTLESKGCPHVLPDSA